ncbi:3716_t:CDS:1, partial [Acaulospora colombiana]
GKKDPLADVPSSEEEVSSNLNPSVDKSNHSRTENTEQQGDVIFEREEDPWTI